MIDVFKIKVIFTLKGHSHEKKLGIAYTDGPPYYTVQWEAEEKISIYIVKKEFLKN
jgi:hypothetical protein